MIICPSCAGENADDAMFCGFCGAKMKAGQKKTLFGVAAIPAADLAKAAQTAREATDKQKAAADAKSTPAAKAAPADADATTTPDNAAEKNAAADATAQPDAAPKAVAAAAPVEPVSAVQSTAAKKLPEPVKKKPSLPGLSLKTPVSGQHKPAQKDDGDLDWSLPSSDTAPTVPPVEEEAKADLETIEEADEEAGITLLDGDVGPTVQMEAVPPLPKKAISSSQNKALNLDKTMPSASPAAKAEPSVEVDTLEDNEPPGADGTVAPPAGEPLVPTIDHVKAGEATLKSGASNQPLLDQPSIQVRESAVASAVTQSAPASSDNPAITQPGTGKPADKAPAPSAPSYPAPVVPGGKEDEEAFFGASLSQYGMAPIQKAPTPAAPRERDSDLKPSGGTNWGLIIFGFLVAALIIGAIAFLMIAGSE